MAVEFMWLLKFPIKLSIYRFFPGGGVHPDDGCAIVYMGLGHQLALATEVDDGVGTLRFWRLLKPSTFWLAFCVSTGLRGTQSSRVRTSVICCSVH